MSNTNRRPRTSRALATIWPLLESCGYSEAHLRVFDAAEYGQSPLVAFAHAPCDARTACIAAVETDGDSQTAVAGLQRFAAPIAFVCRSSGVEWWQQGANPRRLGPPLPPDDVTGFFRKHKHEFAPDAIYRAKTWGRFDRQFQLSFVDLGLMPAVEAQLGETLRNLIVSNVQRLNSLFSTLHTIVNQSQLALKSVFWLVSAKILHDKTVGPFRKVDLTDIELVLKMVSEHLGAQPIHLPRQHLSMLRKVAENLFRHSSLDLVTTESLAHVYETTLISRQTRIALGTHSTPSYLVDYIVGRLKPLIEQIDVDARHVFEPACGHAAFLVSAMRLLTELHPDGADAASRRVYLRRRLHGCDIDAFAIEIARLSLSLTDIPNPNGWDLRIGDMYADDTLKAMARKTTVLLANPPFQNFTRDESRWYSRKGVRIHHVNKTAEMISRVIPELPQGAVLGIVVPQGILHNKNATPIRKALLHDFCVQEVCQLPDNVFAIGESESSLLIAQRKSPRLDSSIRVNVVRQHELDRFKREYVPSSTSSVLQGDVRASPLAAIRTSDLQALWDNLATDETLSSVAELGQGFAFKGKNLSAGAITYQKVRFAGSQQGFVHFDNGIGIHELPAKYWVNLGDEVILHRRTGLTTGLPQVLVSYARVSRGPWKLKALLDFEGHPTSSRFITVRLRSNRVSLETIWAILNSPVGCGFAFTHSMKRDILVGLMRTMPVPNIADHSERIADAARAYLRYMQEGQEVILRKPINFEKARTLLLQVDAEVLRMYNLPVALERQLLDYFGGFQRVGVPFKFERYYPKHFNDDISLSDYLAITSDWSQTNRMRGELIKKKVARVISPVEMDRLSHLQSLASSRANLIAPLPMAELDRLHREVYGDAE